MGNFDLSNYAAHGDTAQNDADVIQDNVDATYLVSEARDVHAHEANGENPVSHEDLPQAIEALLFVSDEAVSVRTLCEMTFRDEDEVREALASLQAVLLERKSGIILREVAGGWKLFTNPAMHDVVERYVLSWDTRRLSQAALETLSIVAYNQPITRAGVAAIRGVSSDSSINSLVEKGLVRPAGKEDSPGQPQLYATTTKFLEHFGLTNIKDLPNLEDYAPDEESKERIRERLGITRQESDDAMSLFAEDADVEIDLAQDIVDIRQGYMQDMYPSGNAEVEELEALDGATDVAHAEKPAMFDADYADIQDKDAE